MSSVTLLQIKDRARQKADMENSNFIEDPELLNYINEAYYTWYDMIVEVFEDYYLNDDPTEFTLASGESTIDLPADFYKLAGIDKAISTSGDKFYALKKTLWRQRNQVQNRFSYYGLQPQITYRIFKDKIKMTPPDAAGGTYRLYYIPLATALVLDTDVIETYNGFENLLIIDVAIKMLNKEESDPSMLLMERQRLEMKMTTMLVDRDINNGECIEDTNSEWDDDWGQGGVW
jgi:hypothetical protein